MGRWLKSLPDTEKSSRTAKNHTDETDRTPSGQVSSVLSVSSRAIPETFSRSHERSSAGFVSFVSNPPGAFPKKEIGKDAEIEACFSDLRETGADYVLALIRLHGRMGWR
jgi:hypothetical protein